MVLGVESTDRTMYPAANRPPHHPVVGQQSHTAGYFGYYQQQPAHHHHHPHHHHHHHHQYAPPDLNCNLQPFMAAGQFTDGLQSSAWHSPMYMAPAHHPAAAHCQQRSPSGYEDWTPSLHHSGGVSPLPQAVPSSGLHQPPHTPSPCAAAAHTAPASPNYPHYQKVDHLPNAHHDYAGDSVVPAASGGDGGGGGGQSPHNGLPLSDATQEAASPPTVAPPARPQQVRSPFEWMKKPSYPAQPNQDAAYLDLDGLSVKGKTRTKDKYRVVYSDHQRLELEKEFHYSRYITIRRKSELASMLGLSERQVKIWFQNRRAKERKQMKKRDELMQKEKLESVQYHTPTVTSVPPMQPMHPHVSSAQHLPSSKPLMMDVKPILGLD
ncbi:hypothetical protein OTU49_006506 [Cherax quadricarinatus]|uniref:Homeobox domain-containing protein n=1 Tax=Cherax quadricarinatus TaxID=27406 RepID=A0AAW0WNG8_CHEQU|nr:homeobox protein CHOX-CAD-like [Cherax quadricarinatus]